MSAFTIVLEALGLILSLLLSGRAVLQVLFGAPVMQAVSLSGALAAGSVFLYLAMLVLRHPAWTLAAVGAAAAVGALQLRGSGPASDFVRRLPYSIRSRWWELLIAAMLAAVIVAEPVFGWDPRSIWFYHAKVIYYDGLDTETWRYVGKEVSYSHPAYPKLLPVLAGVAGCLFGLWNDFLPKIGIAIVAIPGLFLGASLFPGWRTRALFWLFALAAMRSFLWNGYMDGLLALWASVALLHVLAGTTGAVSRRHAIAGVGLSLAVCISLKMEGWVLAACFAAVLATAHLDRFPAWLRDRPLSRSLFAAAGLALVPHLLWRLYRLQAGLEDSNALTISYLARAWSRLSQEGGAVSIAAAMTSQPVFDLTRPAIRLLTGDDAALMATLLVTKPALLAAVLVSAWALKGGNRTACRGYVMSLAIIALYWGALFAVYLGTSADLTWHLQTSVYRTLLTPTLLMLALLLLPVAIRSGEWTDRNASGLNPGAAP